MVGASALVYAFVTDRKDLEDLQTVFGDAMRARRFRVLERCVRKNKCKK